jgi:hypothetical protein
VNVQIEGLLQPALAELAIALSVFSLITYLWLGLTILLAGDRRNMVTWASGIGLLLGALFFLSHGALVAARPTSATSAGGPVADFWWRLSWLPAFIAPYLWALIALRYTKLSGAWGRLRGLALAAVAALGALTALLALLSWPSIAHYTDFIRLLDDALRLRAGGLDVSPWVPALGVAFVLYMGACAGFPWAALAVSRLAPRLAPGIGARFSAQLPPRDTAHNQMAPSAAATEAVDRDLRWDPADAWERARPALLAASLCMVVAGGVVAVIGLVLTLIERRAMVSAIAHNLPSVGAQPGRSPLALVLADLCVQGALAGLALMLGWAVVRQGVMVERRLPQRGFLSHWRRMAALAGGFAAIVAWMGVVEPSALPDLLLLVALVAIAIALLTWQSYIAHDRLLAQLRPFMASLTAGQAGWLATDPGEVEREVDALFTSLCRDVLGAAHGRLALSAGRLSHTYTYIASARVSPERAESWPFHLLPRAPLETRDWTLPVSDERGVVALLTLGPRLDGAGYTSTDLEIARACGQRILDGVGGFATARAVASLARRRGLEAELTAALPRRALHDEVLPRLHLAMLQLEAIRAQLRAPALTPALPANNGQGADGALKGGLADSVASRALDLPGRDGGVEAALADEVGEVVTELGAAHRDLAKLMRAAPLASARRVEHGFTGALRAALDGEFRGVFDQLDWDAPGDAAAAADALPPIVADLLLGATLEAARNAGRHGRGGDLGRRLTLRARLSADTNWVTVEVADDGVGFGQAGAPVEASADPSRTRGPESPADGGARTGLLTHGALMALAGGSLTVRGGSPSGAVVTLKAPRGAVAG